jgi:hypothetical protein
MKHVFLFLLGALLMLQACEPGGPEFVEDLDAVIINHDPQFDFAGAATYVLIDSIVHVQDQENPATNVQLPRELDPFILQQVASNLDNLGYTRLETIDNTQPPDLIVQISALATTNQQAFQTYYGNPWWDYWGWYPGWGAYPFFGRGWFPGFSTITFVNYTTGSVNIEMFNPNSPDFEAQQVPRVWVAVLRGLLQQSPAALETRIGNGINRAFQQSPYLIRN